MKKQITTLLLCSLFIGQLKAQGTWTPVTRLAPHANMANLLLMSDGSVICHSDYGGHLDWGSVFDRLTPDSTGSYINGTWSQLPPMFRERYVFSPCMLKDGRVYAA